ncbi:hypothetical protein MNEG_4701 [Monoraphidium neglectum]|uniref:LTD domain-containing protein n=1 Tax=Monoraphidium neglectum TaxID=145388 RepID=A0A0D2ND59_9CHLO|nr:hypothetical protein MNEG_4701 [Monoraphidium neglectum]KIZ03261.1 hypothetical protein MNEG_4701 [Monoraphidium neglectum]|eukprot:XP_013902280.1 hypothetical protein MNEG_4701 [Monoraphidium neglectum]
MASPANGSLAAPGTTKPTDWVELLNTGAAPTSLGGWVLSEGGQEGGKGGGRWQLPPVDLPPGGYLVLIGVGGAGADNASQVEEGPGGIRLLPVPGLKLGAGGKALTLSQPDGRVASSTGEVIRQRPGVSFGLPAGAAPGSPPTFLQLPTPGAANSPAKPAGPFIFEVTRTPDGTTPPGQPLVVSARVAPNGAPPQSVELVWRVNYAPEQRAPMAAAAQAPGKQRRDGASPKRESLGGKAVVLTW